jgi:3-oxoacyl-[acyl-carrier protein] reductase
MRFGLEGKVAMVAAASKGIGFAIARGLVDEGCRVSICARTASDLERAKHELGCEGFTCDVSRSDDISRWHASTVDALGQVDVCVTNTGGPPAGALFEMTDEQWQSGFESTVLNVVRLTRLVAPPMRERGWGRIVHVTSVAAKQPVMVLSISSTLRAGLMALTRLQAQELALHGVTVNSVLPGHTLTDRQRHLAELRARDQGLTLDEALDRQGSETPIGRLASPEEIAAAAVFLCSAQASYVTGQNVLIDGGVMRGLA